MAIELTKADLEAVAMGDHDYINNKGAKFYTNGDYERAVEYYRLAASMGNIHSVCNLGYCYMYARSVEKNMTLALAYFKFAAKRGDLDAIYKLGNIYMNGNDGIEADKELGMLYYNKAQQVIYEDEIDPKRYPSLFFALAKECMPGGMSNTDIKAAYVFLRVAEAGYDYEIACGSSFYKDAYAAVLELLENPIFEEYIDKDDFEDEVFIRESDNRLS